MVPSFVIEPLLPYAEKYDVAFALEIHAGMSFDIPETKAFIDEMKRVNSPYCGLVIDTGIFCDRIPRVFNEFNKQVLGVNPAIIDYFNAFFDQGLDGSQAFDEAHQNWLRWLNQKTCLTLCWPTVMRIHLSQF